MKVILYPAITLDGFIAEHTYETKQRLGERVVQNLKQFAEKE